MKQERARKVTSRAAQTSPFAVLLGRLRRSAGLSQAELARRAGYSQDYVGMLERGVRPPSGGAVTLLAEALGLGDAERSVLLEAAKRASSPLSAVPLVGREREVAALRGHLSGLGPPLLVLSGEPGIGKTHLLREAGRLASSGMTVLFGGGRPNGVPEPFSPLLSILERSIRGLSPEGRKDALEGCGWLVRLLPELSDQGVDVPALLQYGVTVPPEQEQRLVVQAIGRYLANIAGPESVLLILDDLQWADPDALALLVSLLREDLPLRVVAAYRSTEVADNQALARMLVETVGSGEADELALGPLNRQEAAELFERLLESVGPLRAEQHAQVIERSEGLPFYLVSLAEGLRSGIGPHDLPPGITAGVRQRVSAVPDQSQAVLRVAALTGRAVSVDVLARVTDLPEEALLSALEANLSAGLMTEQTDGYRVRHDLIGEAVERDISVARRVVLHRHIGEALEASVLGSTPHVAHDVLGQLAYHYAHGGRPAKAVEYLERAGDAAESRGAHAAAEGYYRDLLGQIEEEGDRARVEMKLGGVLTTAGRYEEALSLLDDAARLSRGAGDSNGELRAAILLVQAHFRRGSAGEGLARLQSLLHASGPPNAAPRSPQLLAVAWMVLTRLLFAAQQYAESMAAGEHAVALAEEVGDRRTWAEAIQMRGAALLFLNRSAEAMALLADVVPVLEETKALESLAYALQILSSQVIEEGPVAGGRPWSERALAVAEQLEDPGLIAIVSSTLGLGYFYSGDWSAARHHLERGVALARSLQFSMHGPLSPTYLAVLEMAEGRWEEADVLLQEAETMAHSNSWTALLTYVRCRQAQLDLLKGRPMEAVARLEPLAALELEWVTATFLPGILARAYLALGDLARAGALADRAIEQAKGTRTWAHTFDALRVRAAVLAQQGRRAEADAADKEARELARRLPFL